MQGTAQLPVQQGFLHNTPHAFVGSFGGWLPAEKYSKPDPSQPAVFPLGDAARSDTCAALRSLQCGEDRRGVPRSGTEGAHTCANRWVCFGIVHLLLLPKPLQKRIGQQKQLRKLKSGFDILQCGESWLYRHKRNTKILPSDKHLLLVQISLDKFHIQQ